MSDCWERIQSLIGNTSFICQPGRISLGMITFGLTEMYCISLYNINKTFITFAMGLHSNYVIHRNSVTTGMQTFVTAHAHECDNMYNVLV